MADQLEGIVQKLIDEDASDDDIKAVIQEYKGREAGEKANLSRVLGPKPTTDFKLPAQKYNTPTIEGEPQPPRSLLAKETWTAARPEERRAPAGGRGTALDVRKSDAWAKDNAPTIGAALATAAGPAAWPAAIALAGAGGTGGALLRGDAPKDALWAGGKEAAYEAGGRGLQALSKIPYRAAIPKSVLDQFPKVDLAKMGLENKVLLGSKTGVETAKDLGRTTTAARNAAAAGVPSFAAQDVRAAFRPTASEAMVARRPDVVQQISDYVGNSMNTIGPTPMGGRGQLARKKILEREGKSAMKAVNSAMAPVNPQFANIEREAITKNLRSHPPMATALDEAQAAVGLNRAAAQTKNSSIFNRISGGGFFNAARSPRGLSGLAIGAHTGFNPQTMRLLDLILSQVPPEQQK